jgi:hypothetical protein
MIARNPISLEVTSRAILTSIIPEELRDEEKVLFMHWAMSIMSFLQRKLEVVVNLQVLWKSQSTKMSSTMQK